MPLSLPPSTPPGQTSYCEPAQISRDNRTGSEVFYIPDVPEQPSRIRKPELEYYVDQNALPPPQPPAVPPQQPAPITLVIPTTKGDDEFTTPDVTKRRVIATIKPVFKIQAPAQAIRHHMNGRYQKVIRAHLLPNRLEL